MALNQLGMYWLKFRILLLLALDVSNSPCGGEFCIGCGTEAPVTNRAAAFDKEIGAPVWLSFLEPGVRSRALGIIISMAQCPPIGPGSTLGQGEIKVLSRLGLGGFGEVFLAQTREGLRAVKVVDTSAWSDKEYQVFNTMLMNEASFLSTLDHPAIPKSRGFFAEGSRYFLLMDWIPGHTLEQQVQQAGPLAIEDFLALLATLLEVLAYLHGHPEGVVIFGDLKPANILRVDYAKYRLVDLGLTSRQGSKFSRQIAVFSPNYSAPERARGGPSDIQNDVFSLGTTAYFAMTGHEATVETSARDREKRLLAHLRSECGDWSEASRHCLSKMFTLLLAATELDPAARPKGVKPFLEIQRRLAEVKQREGDRKETSRQKIVKLLYSSE